ncbi:MAG: two-component regulator propeller domain-containing protein, partial [Rhodothermales bacterium]
QHDRHNPNSLNHNSVWALYEDPEQPSILWIGTAEGGLNRLDRSTATFTHFVHDPDDPSSLIHNFVEAVYRDREGVLWVGTRGGLDRMNRDGTSFTHYLNEHSNPAYTIVRVIYEAPSESGVLWLSQGLEGLIRLDLDTDTFTSFRHIPDHPTWITSILEDHEGTLWIGSDGNQEGLTRFDRDTETFTHFVHNPDDPNSLRSNSVYCLYEDEAGRLWIGTTGGLSRFDASTQTFTHYTVQNSELPNDVIYGILGDAEGTLWISTLGGLSKFDPLADTFHTYGVDRGLQGRAFNPFASYKNPRGELFFGGTNGFNAFFPGRIRENPYPPQVVVTTFELFNPSRSITEAEPHTIHLTMPDSITLSYGENDLYFEYVGLHYSNPDKNQYAYKLENFEDEWHYVGTQRTATYTSLEPGEYFFRVIASNSDGVWTEEAASVRVVIRPPWWMTGWAYTLYAFLFLAGVFATDRIQRARLIRKERERTQILEAELRAEAAELQAEKAELQAQAVESEARALRAENARKEHELENARELEKAYQTLKATQAQLIQSEKMASLGQLTAGIAHEIKNPLNFVNNFAELCMELAEELDEEIEAHRDAPLAAVAGTLKSTLSDLKINAEQINKHGKRADGIVKSMLMHSRGTPGERGLTDVNQLLEEYVNLSYHGMRANQIGFNATLEQEYDEAVGEVSLVPQDIGRVFINLLNNAFYAVHQKALSSGDAYEPTVSARTRKLERAVEIRIRDNGTGIPARIRRQIFQPFFTTKPTGTGTGLGLSLSYDIVVQGHGGTLDVESEDGQFTEFIITLPA